MSILLHLAFFLSGLAALLFETLWFYQAGLGLGNSVWASSLVLAAFMGGLAVGNGLVGRFGHRIRHPVRFYALLEIVIAMTGFGLVWALPVVSPMLVPLFRPLLESSVGLNALRMGVSFAILLIPASAMGATMPLLVSALYRRDPRFGTILGRLYGWNTLGAVAGAVVGDLFLIASVGIYGSAATAAAVNCSAAGLALALAKRLERQAPDAQAAGPRAEEEPSRLTPRSAALLLAAFLSGAILLALEVVWFRFILLWVLGTSIAFAVMLAVVLSGIGAGGLFAARWLAWRPEAYRALPAVAALSGVLSTATYAGFQLATRLNVVLAGVGFVDTLVFSLPLMFPVSFASGVIFTYLGEALNRESPGETRSAGYLTLANTLGAMLGSLIAGFALLPALGIERSIFGLSLSYGIVMLAALLGGSRDDALGRRVTTLAAAAALMIAVTLFPHGLMRRSMAFHAIAEWVGNTNPARSSRVEAMREGLTETLIYLSHRAFGEPFGLRLFTNNHSMSGTVLRSQRYMKLFVYWPVAVHPDPKNALLISYGVGSTAKALTDTAGLSRIDVVDISKDILEMSRLVYPEREDHPLNDPRVHVHIEDGRYFLQTTDRRYDIITGEPPPPRLAGVVSLYTREYFELMHDRLAEGGIATYWLPVHSLSEADAKAIIHAFCDAFADCTLWGGSGFDFMLTGTRGVDGPVTAEQFARQWQDPIVGPEIRALGFEHPEQLAALYMGGRGYLIELAGDTPPLTDAFPKRLGYQMVNENDKFRYWRHGIGSRRHFETDSDVARVIPEEIAERALDYFDDQAEIRRAMLGEIDPARRLPVIHRWLSDTDLVTAPLFLLGSDPQYDRAIRAAWQRGQRAEPIHYYYAASALAQRDYDTAAEIFRKAPDGGEWSVASRLFEAYSLARAGRCTDARGRMRSLGLQIDLEAGAAPFLEALDELCPTTTP